MLHFRFEKAIPRCEPMPKQFGSALHLTESRRKRWGKREKWLNEGSKRGERERERERERDLMYIYLGILSLCEGNAILK